MNKNLRERPKANLGKLLVALLGVGLCGTANAERSQDNWDLFADDRQHSIGVRLGDSDSISWGLDATLMFPGNTELAVDYLESEIELFDGDENLSSYSAQFTTDPLATWSAQLTYEHSGERSSLQTQDFGIGLQYSQARWLVGARYLLGKVDLRTTPITPTDPTRRFNVDREAVEVQFATFGEHWHYSLRYLNYQYERNIRLNPNSLVLLRRLGFNTFRQVFGLVDWSASAEAVYHHDKHAWSLGYSQYGLELTNGSGRIPFTSWGYQLTDRLATGILAAAGLGDSEHYAELSLRISF